MRNPDRVDRILKKIKHIWTMNPDLRLTQLIGNLFEAGDIYYKEDDELEKRLEQVYALDLEAHE